MNNKILSLSLALAFAAIGLNAQSSISAGYSSILLEGDPSDVRLGAIYAQFGYELNVSEEIPFTIMPNLRLGTGISSDELYGFDVSLDYLASAAIRFSYGLNETWELYLNPAYTRLGVEFGGWGSEEDTEFGVGFGVLYNFSGNSALDLSFETYDGADAINIGYQLKF